MVLLSSLSINIFSADSPPMSFRISLFITVLMPFFAVAQGLRLPESFNEAMADSIAGKILSQLTLKEKLNEIRGNGVTAFGASLLFSNSVKPVKAGGVKRFHIAPTVFVDGPRGVSFAKGATAFPVTMARGASWDADLEYKIGEAMAEEIRAIGGNYSGAVCMNLLRHPAWGRAQETYGEDPHHLGVMASALVAGIQKHNVQACLKHFAANSMENNRFGGSMNMSERTLHEVYLPHFKKAVENGAASIMSGYNKLNGVYCGESRYLLTDILRNEWGFKGYITSDWMWGVSNTVEGIKAGMNIEMPRAKFYKATKVKAAMKSGAITTQDIDKLVFPILRTKVFFASRNEFQQYPADLLGAQKHIDLTREAAEKSAVLLKNQGNVLPLDKTNLQSVAVVGSLAALAQTGDKGSSSVKPQYIITPLQGVSNYLSGSNVKVRSMNDKDFQDIETLCKQTDAVIVVAGTTFNDEGEYISDGVIRSRTKPNKKNMVVRSGKLGLGGDRAYLHLHQQDIDIIKTAAKFNKKVIVVLVAGAAITVEEWYESVPAVLQTFYNGMEGGAALARIIFGDVNPSGKLPFTVPVNEMDLPHFDSYATTAEYGYYHGYTLFDKQKKVARFPFGFGLSYTEFDISNVVASKTKLNIDDTLQVNFAVKNTGNRSGAEVVQLYIGIQNSKVDMPEKLLRAFTKMALQSGEQKSTTLSVPIRDLAWYNAAKKSWQVDSGTYSLFIGNSSDSYALQRLTFEIDN
jgi:beta-glucosidase